MKPLEKGSTDLWSWGGWGGVGGRDKELESLETAGDLGCVCYQSVDSHGKASCLYRGGQKEVYRCEAVKHSLFSYLFNFCVIYLHYNCKTYFFPLLYVV